jgi:hypothetical protein
MPQRADKTGRAGRLRDLVGEVEAKCTVSEPGDLHGVARKWSFSVSWSTSRCRLPGTLGRCVEKARLSWPALEASPQVGPARPAADEKAAGRQHLQMCARQCSRKLKGVR